MTKKIIQLFLIAVFTAFGVSAKIKYYNKISKPVQEIVTAIRKHNILESATIGITGARSEQYMRYMELKKKANAKELVTIIKNDKNGVVKLYAFYALREVDAAEAEKMAAIIDKDKSSIQTMNGCVMDDKKVKDVVKLDIIE